MPKCQVLILRAIFIAGILATISLPSAAFADRPTRPILTETKEFRKPTKEANKSDNIDVVHVLKEFEVTPIFPENVAECNKIVSHFGDWYDRGVKRIDINRIPYQHTGWDILASSGYPAKIPWDGKILGVWSNPATDGEVLKTMHTTGDTGIYGTFFFVFAHHMDKYPWSDNTKNEKFPKDINQYDDVVYASDTGQWLRKFGAPVHFHIDAWWTPLGEYWFNKVSGNREKSYTLNERGGLFMKHGRPIDPTWIFLPYDQLRMAANSLFDLPENVLAKIGKVEVPIHLQKPDGTYEIYPENKKGDPAFFAPCREE